MIRKVIHVPIYNHVVVVYIGSTLEESIKGIEKDYSVKLEGLEYALGFYEVIENKSKKAEHIVVGLSDSCKNTTIAHECLHVAYFILEEVGQKCPQNNHEALAYLMSFLIEEIDKIKLKYGSTTTKNNEKLG